MRGKTFDQIAKVTLHSPTKELTDVCKRLKVEFIKINANNNDNNSNNKKKNN